MRRICLWAMLLVLMVVAPGVAGQETDRRVPAVTATAVAHVRLLERGDAEAVYDLAHPVVRNAVPRQAFSGWLKLQPFVSPVADPDVEGVEFGDWIEPGTGVVHRGVAFVRFSLAVSLDGTPAEVNTTWRYAFDGARWRWLPEIPLASVPDLLAGDDAFPGGYQPVFFNPPMAGIDRFWQAEFFAGNLPYQPPGMVEVETDEAETGCGLVRQVQRLGIFYCIYDATIYYDPAFRDEILNIAGDVGWSAVVAHEWGHHIQALIGIGPGMDGLDVIELELQADCLAAVFLQDQLARGEIDLDAISTAGAVIERAGDLPGSDPNAEGAHGSADDRLAWFNAGIERGYAGCGLKLQPVR